MPPLAIVVPLAVFLALALVFALFVRRVGAAAGDLATEYEFARSAKAIIRQADARLGEVLPFIDEVRRGKADADTILVALDSTAAVLATCTERAESLPVSPIRSAFTHGLIEDLERGERAVELIAHGCKIRAELGGDDPRGEGETAIKRGYLNLLHARDSLQRRTYQPPAASSPRLLALWRRRAG